MVDEVRLLGYLKPSSFRALKMERANMKLNLWMIANRLYQMEPKLYIPEDAPINLQSARLSVVPNCVFVYQKGKDVICDAGKEGGYIIFSGEDYRQIYNLVQDTFDFYQNWEQILQQARVKLDYKMIMEKSWMIFHNPMVLLDGGNKVLSMSSQYDEADVNNDWSYLKQHGYSSPKVIDYLMKEGRNNKYYLDSKPEIYSFCDQNIHMNMVSYALFWKGNNIGRLNILEYDRKLNVGDVELVEFISRYLTETLKEFVEKTDQTGKMMHYFTRMLLGQTISDTEQEYWKQYVCWSSERDYRICVLMFEEELSAQKAISVRNMIQNIFSQVLAVNYDGNIVFSISDTQLEYLYRSRLLNDLLQHVRFRAGLSLPYKKLAELPYAYKQACKAAEYSKSTEKMLIADFYVHAVRYMIENAWDFSFVYACHPDIRRLCENKIKDKEQVLKTYFCYLQNYRSVSATARELKIHKNTLIYRIKRIEELFQYDDASAYTREYMLLSLYIFQLKNKI